MAVAAFPYNTQAPVRPRAYVSPERGVAAYDVLPGDLDPGLNQGLLSWWGRIVHTSAMLQGDDGYALAVRSLPMSYTVRQMTNYHIWDKEWTLYEQVPVRLPDVNVSPVVEEIVGAVAVFASQVSQFAAERASSRGAEIPGFTDMLVGIGRALIANA